MVSEQSAASSRKVVIDAGAAIKLQRLDRFGGELFTTGGVIREIRDENARALLRTLPQELKVREPPAQDILFVKQFAAKTGDLGFLSQNDMELIALTVALHREEGGTVRDRPAQVGTETGSVPFDWAPANASKAAAGPADGEAPLAPAGDSEPKAAAAAGSRGGYAAADPCCSADAAVAHFGGDVDEKQTVDDVLAAVQAAEAAADEAPAEEPEEEEEEGFTEVPQRGRKAQPIEEVAVPEDDEAWDDESDGSSAGEWVTQDNMSRFGLGVEAQELDVRATCATSDYSVQNVLLQMGITPLTFDGYAVRSVKLWGLVCRACFHFTRDTTKVFCPKCGNDTVQRVPIIVDQDGQATILNSGRPMRLKGSVYSIPKVQGGRAWKPLYAEDEILIGGRDRALRHSEKLADKDRANRDPFNEDNAVRAWYQRGGNGSRGGPGDLPRMKAGLGRSNPNANNYKHKTSKKK